MSLGYYLIPYFVTGHSLGPFGRASGVQADVVSPTPIVPPDNLDWSGPFNSFSEALASVAWKRWIFTGKLQGKQVIILSYTHMGVGEEILNGIYDPIIIESVQSTSTETIDALTAQLS